MEQYAIILTAGLVTYATRLTGLLIGRQSVPPKLDRFLSYVPIAVFAALITPDLDVGTEQMLPRILGVVAAGLVVLRVRHLWAGLAIGMAVFWLARAVIP